MCGGLFTVTYPMTSREAQPARLPPLISTALCTALMRMMTIGVTDPARDAAARGIPAGCWIHTHTPRRCMPARHAAPPTPRVPTDRRSVAGTAAAATPPPAPVRSGAWMGRVALTASRVACGIASALPVVTIMMTMKTAQ
eukprot:gene11546-24647_t